MLKYLGLFCSLLVIAQCLVDFSDQHLHCLQDKNEDCYFMILSHPNSINVTSTALLLDQISEMYSGAFQILEISSTHPSYSQVCMIMNVSEKNISISYYVSAMTPLKIKYTQEITLENLSIFVQQMINNRILTLRSEDQPQVQEQIIKLVGTTFNHYIAETDTQTVILFYHHEETRSKFFLPRFQKLGQRLAQNKQIRFAVFNLAMNQLLQNDGFDYLPNILFFHKSTIEPIYYDGPLRFDRVIKWLKSTTDSQWIEPQEESSEEGIQQYR